MSSSGVSVSLQFVGAHERHTSESVELLDVLSGALAGELECHAVPCAIASKTVLTSFEEPPLALQVISLVEASYLARPAETGGGAAAAEAPPRAALATLGSVLPMALASVLRDVLPVALYGATSSKMTVACLHERTWERYLTLLWSVACAAPPPALACDLSALSDDDLRDGLLMSSLSPCARECLAVQFDCVERLLSYAFCDSTSSIDAVDAERDLLRSSVSRAACSDAVPAEPLRLNFVAGYRLTCAPADLPALKMSSRVLCRSVAFRARDALLDGVSIAVAARAMRDCERAVRGAGGLVDVAVDDFVPDTAKFTMRPWTLRTSVPARVFPLTRPGDVEALARRAARELTVAAVAASNPLVAGHGLAPGAVISFLHYVAAIRAVLAPVSSLPAPAVSRDIVRLFLAHSTDTSAALLRSVLAEGPVIGLPRQLDVMDTAMCAYERIATESGSFQPDGTITSAPLYCLRRAGGFARRIDEVPRTDLGDEVRALCSELERSTAARPGCRSTARAAATTAFWSLEAALFERSLLSPSSSGHPNDLTRSKQTPEAGLSRAAMQELLRVGLSHPACRAALMLFIVDGCGWLGPVFLGLNDRPRPATRQGVGSALRSPMHTPTFLLSADPAMPVWLWDAVVGALVDESRVLCRDFDRRCAAALLSTFYRINSAVHVWSDSFPFTDEASPLRASSPPPLRLLRSIVAKTSKLQKSACPEPLRFFPRSGVVRTAGDVASDPASPKLPPRDLVTGLLEEGTWLTRVDLPQFESLHGFAVLLDTVLHAPLDVALAIAETLAALSFCVLESPRRSLLDAQQLRLRNIATLSSAVQSLSRVLLSSGEPVDDEHAVPSGRELAGSKRRRAGSVTTKELSAAGERPLSVPKAYTIALSSRAIAITACMHKQFQALLTGTSGPGLQSLYSLPPFDSYSTGCVQAATVDEPLERLASCTQALSSEASANRSDLLRWLVPLACMPQEVEATGRWLDVEVDVHAASFARTVSVSTMKTLWSQSYIAPAFVARIFAPGRSTKRTLHLRLRVFDRIAAVISAVANSAGVSERVAERVIVLPSVQPAKFPPADRIGIEHDWFSAPSHSRLTDMRVSGTGRWPNEREKDVMGPTPGTCLLGFDGALPLLLADATHLLLRDIAESGQNASVSRSLKLVAVVDASALSSASMNVNAGPPVDVNRAVIAQLPAVAAPWRALLSDDGGSSALEMSGNLLGIGQLLTSVVDVSALLVALADASSPSLMLASRDADNMSTLVQSRALDVWHLLSATLPSSPLVYALLADPASIPWAATLSAFRIDGSLQVCPPPLCESETVSLANFLGGTLASVYLLRCARAFLCPPFATFDCGDDNAAEARSDYYKTADLAACSALNESRAWAASFINSGGLSAVVEFLLQSPKLGCPASSDAEAVPALSFDVAVQALLRTECVGLIRSLFDLAGADGSTAGGAAHLDTSDQVHRGQGRTDSCVESPEQLPSNSSANLLVGSVISGIASASVSALPNLVRLLWSAVLAVTSETARPLGSANDVPVGGVTDHHPSLRSGTLLPDAHNAAVARVAAWSVDTQARATRHLQLDGATLLQQLTVALDRPIAASPSLSPGRGGSPVARHKRARLDAPSAGDASASFIGGDDLISVLRLAVAAAPVGLGKRESSYGSVVNCFRAVTRRSHSTCINAILALLEHFIGPVVRTLDPENEALRIVSSADLERGPEFLEQWIRALLARDVAPSFAGDLGATCTAAGGLFGILSELQALVAELPSAELCGISLQAEYHGAMRDSVSFLLRSYAAVILLGRPDISTCSDTPASVCIDGLTPVGRPAAGGSRSLAMNSLPTLVRALRRVCASWLEKGVYPPWFDEPADYAPSSGDHGVRGAASCRGVLVSLLVRHVILPPNSRTPQYSSRSITASDPAAVEDATELVRWALNAAGTNPLPICDALLAEIFERAPLLGVKSDELFDTMRTGMPSSESCPPLCSVGTADFAPAALLCRGPIDVPTPAADFFVVSSRTAPTLRDVATAALRSSELVPPGESYAAALHGASVEPRDAPTLASKYLPAVASATLTAPYVGLVNQGATCYQNSFLQQLFMTPAIRHFVLGSADSHAAAVRLRLEEADSRSAAGDPGRASHMMGLRETLQVGGPP